MKNTPLDTLINTIASNRGVTLPAKPGKRKVRVTRDEDQEREDRDSEQAQDRTAVDSAPTSVQLAQADKAGASAAAGAALEGSGVTPSTSAEAPTNTDHDKPSVLAWLGLGGLALAAAGGSGSGSGTGTAAVNNTVTGTVVAGPVIGGNGLKVEIYAANGTTKLGEALLDATGKFTVKIGTYSGIVIARVIDTNVGTDYLDEATGTNKDLNATLMATTVVPGGTVTLNINPLTAIAAQKAGLAADGSGSLTNSTDVTNANAAVAAAFGLTDLTGTTVVATNGGSYDPNNGLSESEKYGAILAALSGADQKNGGDSQATINTLVANLTVSGTGGTLNDQALDLLISGANTADANVSGSALTAVGSTLTGNTANDTVTAAAKIASYADANSNPAPSVTDYAAAGIPGVTAANLAQVNARVDGVDRVAADTAPEIQLLIAPVAPDFDIIASDDTINAAEVGSVITGTNEAGATVALTIGSNTRTATVTGTTWRYTLTVDDITAMSQGAETLSATQIDAAGNTSAAGTHGITVDTAAPTITSSTTATAINENSGAGQTVYTATSTDSGDTATGATVYSLKAGSDAAALSINASSGAVTLTGNPDFESKPSYGFTVVATDAAGNASEQAVSLAVNNLDEVAPTLTSGATASAIDENSGTAQVVYTATSTDTADTATGATVYSLKAGSDAAALSINASSGAVTLTGNPDFESKPSYGFTVVATDAAGNASEQAVSLAVKNLDEVAPTISGIALTSASGIQGNILNAGDVLSVTVTMSEATTVQGYPTLALNIGASGGQAEYVSGSGTTALVFNYTLLAGQTDADGISINEDSLIRGGARLMDASGNVADLTHAALASNGTYVVDTSIAIPTLALASDTGSSATDGITNSGQINVNGLETGATWQYSTDTGSNWTTGSGTNFTLNGDGAKVVQVRQTDLAGNVSDSSASLSFTLDQTVSTLTTARTYQLQPNPVGATASTRAPIPALGDINGDGLMDLVIGEVSVAASDISSDAVTVRAYLQQLDGSFVLQDGAAGSANANPFGGIDFAADLPSSSIGDVLWVALIDVDTDGKTDMLVSYAGNADLQGNVTAVAGILYYRNTGTAQVPAYQLQQAADNPFSTIARSLLLPMATGDVDGDGDADLVLGNFRFITNGPSLPVPTEVFAYWRNNGDGTFTQLTGEDNPMAIINTLALTEPSLFAQIPAIPYLGDFNGDGKTDFGFYQPMLSRNDPVLYLPGDGAGGFSAVVGAVSGLSIAGMPAAAVADINDDGLTDIALTNGTNTVSLHYQTLTQAVSLDTTQIRARTDVLNAATYDTANLKLQGNGAQAQALINVYAGGQLLKSTQADAQGEWNLIWSGQESGFAIAEGNSYAITVTQTDAAGNTSVASTAYTLTVASPPPTLTDLSLSHDTGALGNDFITITASQTVTATISHELLAAEKVFGLVEETQGWIDITAKVIGTTLQWDGVVLPASGEIRVRVDNGISFNVVTQNYVLDTSAPTMPNAVLSTDSGISASDGITHSGAITAPTNTETGGLVEYRIKAGTDEFSSWSPTYTAPTTDGAYTVEVRQSDVAGNASTSQTISFTLDSTPPSLVTGDTATAIDENSGTNQVIYTAQANDTVSYSLKAGSDAGLSIDASTGEVTLAANPNFASKPSYGFTVVATDAAGNASEQAVSLAVNNLDEVAPTITSGATATAIDENSGTNQVIYTATSTDTADTATGATVYSLKAFTGDTVAFSINASTGAVTLTGNPDFETKASYGFTVVATDAAGNASEKAVTLAIKNLDEVAPTITSGATASAIDENSGAGQVVYIAASTDSGDTANGATVYSLKAGSDAAALSINASSGAVTLTANPDYETQDNYAFTVVATDADGNIAEQSVNLSITDMNDAAPTISSVTLSSATGIQNNALNEGDVLNVTVTLSQVALVTGTPQLALNVGGSTVQALYASGSGTTALVFTYTLLADQTDDNGISINANSLTLNGGSLADAAGNAAVLTHSLVADNSSYLVDNAMPTVTLTSNASALKVGDTATLTFTFSQNPGTSFTEADVTVSGGTLGVTNGTGLVRTATFTPTEELASGNASVTVAKGSYTNAAGTLGDAGTSPAISIDTVAPMSTNLLPADGTNVLPAGNLVLTFDEDMAKGSGNIRLVNETDNSTTIIAINSSEVTVSGTTLTINPTADLIAGNNYHIEIDSGALTDLAGNGWAGISNATDWNFVASTPAISLNAIATDNLVNLLESTSDIVVSGKVSSNDSAALAAFVPADFTVILTSRYTDPEISVTVTSYNDQTGEWSGSIAANTLALDAIYDVNVMLVGSTSVATGLTTTTTGLLISDLAPPAAPTISTVAGDDIINASETGSLITGRAEGSASIALSIGGNTRDVKASGTGNWSYSLTEADIAAMDQGAETLSAVQTDTVGNTSAAGTRPITVSTTSTTPLSAPFIDNVATDNSISAAEDNSTITGRNAAGATVALTLGGNTRAATVNGTTWSYTLTEGDITAMDQGAETLSATQSDAVGNTSKATTRYIDVDTIVPTVTHTSGTYDSATNKLVLTGTDFTTLLEQSYDDASSDIKARLDWSKISWDINGDDATTANVSFAVGDISSAKVTDGTHLTIVLTTGKGIALEATNGFGMVGFGLVMADTLDITAGFAKDATGNVAATDAVVNAPLTVAAPTAGDAVIDLGFGVGKLIAPVQVEGKWYYFWDASGNGVADIGDFGTHDWLDFVFSKDIYGVPNTTVRNSDLSYGTTETYRYGVINGVKLALPTDGFEGASFDPTSHDPYGTYYSFPGAANDATANSNAAYDDLLAIWDAKSGNNTEQGGLGVPSGWVNSYYWSATPSLGQVGGHAIFNLGLGIFDTDANDTNRGYVALQVLEPDTAPTIRSIALSSATGIQNGVLNTGDMLRVTVTMSESITVTGTPQLELDIGGTTVQAQYASGSGSTALVFTYTILADQTDAYGISINANSLTLNGGTFKDETGNAALLTHSPVADNDSYVVDTTAPTVTHASADYTSATNTLVLTGTQFSTLLKSSENASTDIKARLDWSKLSWDINGDNATTANAGFVVGDISSAQVTDGTHLTVVLTTAKGSALEATSGYGGVMADTLDITAGFTKDAAGNVATTDGMLNAALTVSPPVAGDAVIDLAGAGKLIAPTQVGDKWYYFWDTNNDGSAGTADVATHNALDVIFKNDSPFTGVNPNWTGAATAAGNNTTDTYHFATLNGVKVALPNSTELATVFPTNLPLSWMETAAFLGVSYWSATLSGAQHLAVSSSGVANSYVDTNNGYVALQVL